MAGSADGCDHEEVTGRDLLESGSARPRSRPAPRRLVGIVTVVLLAAVAVMLAARSSGRPAAAPAPRPAPMQAPVGAAGDPPLVPAVLRRGGDTVAAITADGGHLLLRHDHQAGWTVVPLPA
jgi:hypothetical protein